MTSTKRDKLDRIAELWASGMLTEDIAHRLNTTKGSVCRMARDARLAGDPRFPARPRFGRNAMLKPPPPKSRVRPCLFVDLQPNDCKYPVRSEGDRGEIHWFCANPRAEGSPYCKTHKDLTDARTRGATTLTTWAKS